MTINPIRMAPTSDKPKKNFLRHLCRTKIGCSGFQPEGKIDRFSKMVRGRQGRVSFLQTYKSQKIGEVSIFAMAETKVLYFKCFKISFENRSILPSGYNRLHPKFSINL